MDDDRQRASDNKVYCKILIARDAIYIVHDDLQRASDNKVLVVASSLTMFIVKFF